MKTKRFLIVLLFSVVVSALIHAEDEPDMSQNAAIWNKTRADLVLFQEVNVSHIAQFPNESDSETARTFQKMDSLVHQMKGPPPPIPLPPLATADRSRWCAFLELKKAQILSDYAFTRKDLDSKPEQIALANAAIQDADAALVIIDKFSDPKTSRASPEDVAWLIDDSTVNHLHHIKALAYAALWGAAGGSENAKLAKQEWQLIEMQYAARYPPASTEMQTLLGMIPAQQGMTEVSYIGVGILILGAGLTWFFPRSSLFSQWVMRTVIAIGGAMASTVIPGILNIDLDKRVMAGGALAVIVVFYLFNPPKIEGTGKPDENK